MTTTAKKNTVLVVEDNSSMSRVLSEKLTRTGYVVVQASNGEEGLESAVAKRPDIILLDVLMPVMDGLAMLKKLRALGEVDPWAATVPVILLTNLSSDIDVIQKPLETDSHTFVLEKTRSTLAEIIEKVNERITNPDVYVN